MTEETRKRIEKAAKKANPQMVKGRFGDETWYTDYKSQRQGFEEGAIYEHPIARAEGRAEAIREMVEWLRSQGEVPSAKFIQSHFAADLKETK